MVTRWSKKVVIWSGALALLGSYAPAQASYWTIEQCKVLIGTLQSETSLASASLTPKDYSKLESRLVAATMRIDQSRTCDAVKKSADYGRTVASIAAQGGVAVELAAGLSADAARVSECVTDVACQAGAVCPGVTCQ